eukprot:gene9136-12322_t
MAYNNSYGNVLFLGVARIANQGIVVASYSYNTETDLGGVKQVLEQPNLNMSPGKHYSFAVGQLAWHLIADDLGLIYIVICQASYPQRCAHMCLEELQRTFVAKAGDKATTARDRQLDKLCSSLLLKICQKYDNLAEVDKLAAVAKKVETVKLVMQENVDIALQNCVKLETIERAAEELQQQAGVFKRNANELKNKMWWKNIKMKLIIAAIILVILGIIIAIIVVMTKKK